ncbi:heat shock factor binding protein, partial [Tanacetum coccineum]
VQTLLQQMQTRFQTMCPVIQNVLEPKIDNGTKNRTDLDEFVKGAVQTGFVYYFALHKLSSIYELTTLTKYQLLILQFYLLRVLMGDRINELEQSINDLRTEMGADGSPSPLSTSKKPDEPKSEEGSA